jgi:hypothetical protein
MAVPLTGQVAVTASAQPLSASPVTSSVFTIKASALNINSVYIGAVGVTTTTGYELAAGESFDYERSDQSGQPRLQLQVSDFSVIGTAGTDRISWLAS